MSAECPHVLRDDPPLTARMTSMSDGPLTVRAPAPRAGWRKGRLPRTLAHVRFMATIDIAAPAQLVYEVYTDVERWPEWTASVTSVELLHQGPLRVGSRARIKQPRLPTAVWEVTEVVTGRSFTWIARGPGIMTTASHVVTPPEADGPTRVTASLQQTGR